MSSLRRRLTVGLTASAALAFGLLYVVTSGALRTLVEGQMASRLEHDAETLLAALRFDPDGISLEAPHIDPIYQRPLSGHYYRIESGGELTRSRSLWDADLAPLAVTRGAPRVAHQQGPAGQPLLVFAGAYRKQGRELTIVIGEDLSDIEAEIGRFQRTYALITLILLVALVAIQLGLLLAGLRPLGRIHEQLGAIRGGRLAALDEVAPDEIAPLVTAFNRVLQALENRVSRSRKALGNVAHALKTPLAVILQTAQDAALADRPAARRTLIEQGQRIGLLVDQELRRARVVGHAAPGEVVAVDAALADLVETLSLLHHDKGLAIELHAAEAPALSVDRQDLLELFGNLLDNACKWAQTRVAIVLREDGGEVVVTIDDDGPGIPPQRLGQILQRGARIDETTAGHGLGLDIARDIVGDYGGRLELGPSPACGGLRVEVRLPLDHA